MEKNEHSDDVHILIDISMTKRIISNLLNNSLKFTNTGFVKITCDLINNDLNFDKKKTKITYGSNTINTKKILVIEIEDTSCGMDEHKQKHIKDLEFFSFSNENGNYGLGL